MRISSPLLLCLAACGKEAADTQVDDDGRIFCATGGAEAFARVCTVDRQRGARGLILTARHPDGGFRRFQVTRDGRGMAAADGAQAADVTIVGAGEIEVGVGDDAYRFPATIRSGIGAK